MKVAFYCPNKNLSDVDFRNPSIGNPGCGATEYLQIAIPYMLNLYYGSLFESIIIADNTDNLPKNIPSYKVSEGLKGSILKAKQIGVDIFVFKPSMSENEEVFKLIEKIKLNSVALGQLTPNPKCIGFLSKYSHIKSFVCVGLNQYDHLIDTNLSKKLFQINNPITDNFISSIKTNKDFYSRKDIVYMGALFPQKNFLYLAKNWHRINMKLPFVKLHVIGSAKTYGENFKLGRYGLAEENYENLFMEIIHKNKETAKNVIFHGNLNAEKFSYFSNCRVGIVNPLGTTETCCVSAVEMQALGLPICTGNYEALRTTILHNKSGLLSTNEAKFRKNIVQLYNDEKLFKKLSYGAIMNAKLNFSFSQIIHKWYYLFFKIYNDQPIHTSNEPSFISRKISLLYFFRILNKYFLKNLLGFRNGSVITTIGILKNFKNSLLRKYRK